MQIGNLVEFRTLLTEEEYNRLMEKFKGNRMDMQTNHYFDTKRFSLKALDASLRVKERDDFTLVFKKKKGYNLQEFQLPITKETFEEIRETGMVPEGEIYNELIPLIGDQKIFNFLSLSTLRLFFAYKNGILYIDKSQYLGQTDYELIYETSSHNLREFVKLISEFELQYKKTEKKIKRAFKAYKKMH
ncbi:MAG TPA: CYTH domain-containing protein [Acholeplasmataceae bacterium]|jgi:uncharacterized protein YjbK|nr:CYTH domain-containing protein [Acholeplasmataceae bacterium]